MIQTAVCQIVGNEHAEANTRKMLSYIDRAVAERPGLDMIVFPEYCYGSPPAASPLPAKGIHTELIAEAAGKHRVNILAGSFMRKTAAGKFSNTVYFYNRSGEIVFEYSKSHLMCGSDYDEAEFVEPGNALDVLETDFGTIGVIVCYELRFPEIARSLVMAGADILFCPAEFPVGKVLPSRTDHWDLLVRATALQNLTWTVAANNYGSTPSGEHPFGRSMIVDPRGTVVSQCRDCEDICYAGLDLEYQKTVRDEIGSIRNRRPELYEGVLRHRIR